MLGNTNTALLYSAFSTCVSILFYGFYKNILLRQLFRLQFPCVKYLLQIAQMHEGPSCEKKVFLLC